MSQNSFPGTPSARNLREGLRILEWLSRRPDGAGVRETAAALGLTHSSAHRFLETMSRAGWVHQIPQTQKYELGPMAIQVGMTAVARMDLRFAASRELREIARRTGETAYLGVLVGDRVVYIDIVPGGHAIGLNRPVGWTYWAFRTAVGKVLLASLPLDQLSTAIPYRRLPRTGRRGVTALPGLRRELVAVQRAGFATNDEESEPGVYGIAVPIRDGRSRVVAGLGIGGPKERVRPRRDAWVQLLREHADRISAALGYPGVRRSSRTAPSRRHDTGGPP